MEKSPLFGQNPEWKQVKRSVFALITALLSWGVRLPSRPLAIGALILYGYIGIITGVRIGRIIRSSFFDASLIGLILILVLCLYIVQLSIGFLKRGRL